MARRRITRVAAIAVAISLSMMLAGVPATAGAAPPRARAERSSIAAQAAVFAALADPDDDIPGVDATLPLNATGTLDAIDATNPVDTDDVYRVYLKQGDLLVATLSVDPTVTTDGKPAWVGLELYGPGAVSIDLDWPLAWSEEDTSVMRTYAPITGYYFLVAWAQPPAEEDTETGEPAYPGWAGSYALEAQAVPPAATAINIRRSVSSARIGRSVLLYGSASPRQLIGRYMTLKVLRPRKTYWSVLAKRRMYLLSGWARWSYRYYFKHGMARGYYRFRASYPASPGLRSSASGIVSVRLR